MNAILYFIICLNIGIPMKCPSSIIISNNINLNKIDDTHAISDSLITKEVIIGVNWHIGSLEACSHSLYLAGNLLNDSLYLCEKYDYFPSILFFDSTNSLTALVNKGYMIFDYSIFIRRCYDTLKYQKFRDFFDNIPKGIHDSLSFDYKDPFIQYIYPDNKKENIHHAFNGIMPSDSLPNYYRLPRSPDWDNIDEPYFPIISKVFYLILFKCKLTYYLNCSIEMPVPNLELDLSSTNPDKRSLCSYKIVPAPVIVKIENIEPYNIR
jgi:hypothetical protein